MLWKLACAWTQVMRNSSFVVRSVGVFHRSWCTVNGQRNELWNNHQKLLLSTHHHWCSARNVSSKACSCVIEDCAIIPYPYLSQEGREDHYVRRERNSGGKLKTERVWGENFANAGSDVVFELLYTYIEGYQTTAGAHHASSIILFEYFILSSSSFLLVQWHLYLTLSSLSSLTLVVSSSPLMIQPKQKSIIQSDA